MSENFMGMPDVEGTPIATTGGETQAATSRARNAGENVVTAIEYDITISVENWF